MHGTAPINIRLLRLLLAATLTCSGVAIAPQVLAHGAAIDYTVGQAISISAAYDSGTPMADAQVAVFTPSDPSTPWMTGTTDAEGRFTFMPDPSIPGNWEVQVRQAGHGDIISIPIGESATAESPSGTPTGTTTETARSTAESPATTGSTGSLSTVQRWIMIACVIWGFIGTALFFSRRATTGSAHLSADPPNAQTSSPHS
jgi:nickel transport protein